MPAVADPLPTPETVIEQKLTDCGLDRAGFTVKYEEYLQSIEIVIAPEAGASKQVFSCIAESAGYEIVTFTDGVMQMAYSEFVTESMRPEMLASAEAALAEKGMLEGFPLRDDFASDELYAQALERHLGFVPGSIFTVSGNSLVFNPPKISDYQQFVVQYSPVFLAMQYAIAKGDFENFGFIGNEKLPEGEGH